MISPSIQKIVFEEKLPQMAAMLDEVRMGELFEKEIISGTGQSVKECQIDRVKYRPEKNCLVSYRLKLVERKTGQEKELPLYLLAYPEGESLGQFTKAQMQNPVQTAIGDGLFHLRRLESVVRIFPNDRKLYGLPLLTNFKQLGTQILPAVVNESFGENWRLTGLTAELIHYVAERACSIRAELELRNRITGENKQKSVIGKTYCSGEGVAAWESMHELWHSDGCRQGRFLIPQPLAFQPKIETIWQSGLIGATMSEFDPDSSNFTMLMEKAGAAVAALHESFIKSAPPVIQFNLITKLKAAERLIVRVRPSLQPILNPLIRRLCNAYGKLGESPNATLHGDLHLKNFFVTGEQVTLIDLDTLAKGDPLLDIGSFVAALRYSELMDGKSFQKNIVGFVEAYRSTVKWEVADSALGWHTSAALIHERAYRCITRLKSGRLEILDEIIGLADQMF